MKTIKTLNFYDIFSRNLACITDDAFLNAFDVIGKQNKISLKNILNESIRDSDLEDTPSIIGRHSEEIEIKLANRMLYLFNNSILYN